jgi:hypothetical protein
MSKWFPENSLTAFVFETTVGRLLAYEQREHDFLIPAGG